MRRLLEVVISVCYSICYVVAAFFALSKRLEYFTSTRNGSSLLRPNRIKPQKDLGR